MDVTAAGTEGRPVLCAQPGLQARCVVGVDRHARPVLFPAAKELGDGVVGRWHGVADHDQPAVLTAVDPLVSPRSVALGLDPDEERLAARRAAGGTRRRPVLEADPPPLAGWKSDLPLHARPR